MTHLRILLHDHLSESITSLSDTIKSSDIVLMIEHDSYMRRAAHHKKKIVLILSAMRHFAKTLREKGCHLHYQDIDHPSSNESLTSIVKEFLRCHDISSIIITEPSEHFLKKEILTWEQIFNIPVLIRPDTRFLAGHDEFIQWCGSKKQLRMEYFYREMRKKHNILMQGDTPEGGEWNYDALNRASPPKEISLHKPYQSEISAMTQEVIDIVEKKYASHFGDIHPFHFAVTAKDAEKTLVYFIHKNLQLFGTYQDAMIENEPWMFHSHISFYLNIGLLLPIDCVRLAEKAYYEDSAPLNSVEGFIRQVIGWREYVRGIYWKEMPEYKGKNFLNAQRKLPSLYWGEPTLMNCMAQVVKETKENAYAHHIQRLMVVGNFALLAGLSPHEVNEWFLIVYADAYEWVELPNVTGMVLYADGGVIASKPYAAGGSYINKMSNYCKNCVYSPNIKTGEKACPFNYLYWDFLDRNKEVLQTNPRIRMLYSTLNKMSGEKKRDIKKSATLFLESLT